MNMTKNKQFAIYQTVTEEQRMAIATMLRNDRNSESPKTNRASDKDVERYFTKNLGRLLRHAEMCHEHEMGKTPDGLIVWG